jgi:hypothetical protein
MMMGGSAGTFQTEQYTTGGTLQYQLTSTALFRDPSAWYHVVVAFDTTQATASDRVKIYINGLQLTSFSTATYPGQNLAINVNTSNTQYIGADPANSAYFDGYMAEIYFVDGQALTASSFGETNSSTGGWQPKAYTGTYGTNGFYLDFKDNSAATATAIGNDASTNSNNWTPSGISVTAGATYDSMTDVPTMYNDGAYGRGNYAVLSSLDKTSDAVLSDGNLKNLSGTTGSIKGARATIAFPSSGKFYAEFTTITTTSAALGIGVQICSASSALSSYTGTGILGFYASNGAYLDNEGTSISIGGALAAGTVLQIAADVTNGKVWFGKNNTWYDSAGGTTGNPSNGTDQTYTRAIVDWFFRAADWGVGVNCNFGQRPFSYTPPTGYKTLNTYNLPAPCIKKGSKYFDATTYTGNSGTLSVTNSGGFQPDLVWGKARNAAVNHGLYDSVRGVSKRISSDLAGAEITDSGVTSFNSNGFTLGSSTSMNDPNPYVAWQWKKGVNQGFDIVTFTAPLSGNFTINHSLGVVPAMIIVKDRSGTVSWVVGHKSLPNQTTYYLSLSQAIAQQNNTTVWGNTAPTATQVTIGVGGAVNASNNGVAYLFAEVTGFSKFGSYTGNGSTDGVFVHLGFLPRFLMIKRTDANDYNWTMYDSARDTFNAVDSLLYPNLVNIENTGTARFDFLSNGFKSRDSSNDNVSSATYIYAAFAELPFKYANAR